MKRDIRRSPQTIRQQSNTQGGFERLRVSKAAYASGDVPDNSGPIYRRMASDSGLPNRKRLSYYISNMTELGYEAQVFVTSVIPEGRLEPADAMKSANLICEAGKALLPGVQSKLDRGLTNVDDADLLIDGILLVARKP